MNNAQPIFDPATHYRIEVRGRVDVEWLHSFGISAEISYLRDTARQQINVEEIRQMEEITVLNVRTDQAGIVGLVRRLHGLGMTILQLQIVSDGEKTAEVKEQR